MERRFGIEMEIAGINRETASSALRAVNINIVSEDYNHATRNHWKIVSDASVRNGFEIVSPILDGEAGIAEAEIVARALDDAGATVNSSCGLHVHFDASDLNLGHLKAIMRRYAAHECEIDAFMPRSRRGNENRYCKSICGFVRGLLDNATSIQNLVELQHDRYFKVNLQSLGRHGTIEFRQHSGKVNAAKIANWVRFLAAFIDECKRVADGHAAVQSAPAALPALSSVQARLAQMFASQGVVRLDEMCAAFGWLDITARAAVTRLRKAGMEITAIKVDGVAAYKFNGHTTEAGAANAAESLWNGIAEAVALFYQRRAAVLAVAA